MSKTKAQLIEEARYLKAENERLQVLCDAQNEDLRVMHHRLRNVIDERVARLNDRNAVLCKELRYWRMLNDLGNGYEITYASADYGLGWYTNTQYDIEFDGKFVESSVSLLHLLKKIAGDVQ